MSTEIEEIYIYKFTYNEYIMSLIPLTQDIIKNNLALKGDSRSRLLNVFIISKSEIIILKMQDSNWEENFEEKIFNNFFETRGKFLTPNSYRLHIWNGSNFYNSECDLRWPKVKTSIKNEILRYEKQIARYNTEISKLKNKLNK